MGVNSKWGLIVNGGKYLRGNNSIKCIKATVVLHASTVIKDLWHLYRVVEYKIDNS